MMKKFVGNQDEYMVENTNFVCEELSHYEEKIFLGIIMADMLTKTVHLVVRSVSK